MCIDMASQRHAKRLSNSPCSVALQLDVLESRSESELDGLLSHPLELSCNFSEAHLFAAAASRSLVSGGGFVEL